MGEHADDGDREADEEPSVPSSDDSPPEHIEDGDPDESRASQDASTADPSDADENAGHEDATEGTTDDANADANEDEAATDGEAADAPPDADEWLAENPDYESGMDEFEDVGVDDADDADGDVDAADDANADADEDESAADATDETEDEVGADTDDGVAADDGGDAADDPDAESDGSAGDSDDVVWEPDDAREARARAAADDRSPEEQDAALNLDDDSDDSDDASADAAAGDSADADTTASASAPVSTTDPGKNAPAGMGQPTPAGGGGGATGSAGGFPDFDGDMAPDDEEQPLTEHIEEMTHRFLYVALVMGLVGAVALLGADDMINFLWYSFLGPNDGTCPGTACPVEWRPHLYHPLSLILARLKMAALVGFVAGLPVAVYQIYRFMRPGLYPHERRYYLAAVPTSLVLAVAGVGFAYYVVLPSLFIYFSGYSTQAAELAFALSDTFNLMVMMLGFFAVVFQIPLLVMLAIMMGVTTRRWLEQRRIYFWTGFGGVAFFFSPDPTGMAPLLVAVTMIGLFEGTLLLLRWTERSVALFSAETLENNRPYAWALAAFVGYVVSAAPVPEGYFDELPPVVVETLTEWGYVALTPALIAAAIIAVFEILGWIARRVGAGQGRRTGLRVRLAFLRIRPFVWLLALVIGYMGSPDPVVLDVFREVSYSPLVAAGTAVGLIVAYEALRLVLSYVRPD